MRKLDPCRAVIYNNRFSQQWFLSWGKSPRWKTRPIETRHVVSSCHWREVAGSYWSLTEVCAAATGCATWVGGIEWEFTEMP
ncbi:hypothetical protein COP2_010491 [Malus domestica]